MEPVSLSRAAPRRLLLLATRFRAQSTEAEECTWCTHLPLLRISPVATTSDSEAHSLYAQHSCFFVCAAAIGGYLKDLIAHCVVSDNFAFVEIGRISQLCFSRQSCFSSVRFCVYRPAIQRVETWFESRCLCKRLLFLQIFRDEGVLALRDLTT